MRPLALVLLLGSPAFGRAFEQACGEDARRLCPTLTGAGALACLLGKRPDASTACWNVIGGLEPCAGDIDRRCNSAEPGGGHVIRCLESQRRDLSRSCALALDEAEKTMRSHGYQPPK